jgi:hypothetical protein
LAEAALVGGLFHSTRRRFIGGVDSTPGGGSESENWTTNLSFRMGSRRFTRLTNGFSKKLDNHLAAVALYVAHYNLCRWHETIRSTSAEALGLTDHAWSIGELLDASLAIATPDPTETAPDRRKRFRVIEGGKK